MATKYVGDSSMLAITSMLATSNKNYQRFTSVTGWTFRRAIKLIISLEGLIPPKLLPALTRRLLSS